MLKKLFAFGYRVRKPRIYSENDRALLKYRKDLTNTRRQIHKQSNEYQDKIENQYLQEHKQKVSKMHFENQCQFRKHIIQDSFLLSQQIKKWKKTDEKKLQLLDKYVSNEQLKRINRQRIKKILEYESQNYWFNGDNVEEKLTTDIFFPPYLGQTEYYHKLHLEALAYSKLDFKTLEQVTSIEEVLKQKNRLMIPLYKQVLSSIRQLKRNPYNQLEIEKQTAQDKIVKLYKTKQSQGLLKESDKLQKDQLIQQTRARYDRKLEQMKRTMRQGAYMRKHIKERLKKMVILLKLWHNYTSILSMSSAEIYIRKKQKADSKKISHLKQRQLNKNFRKQNNFVSLAEQDTEDEEMTFQQFYERINKDSDLQVVEISKQQTPLDTEQFFKSLMMEEANQTSINEAQQVQQQKPLKFLDLKLGIFQTDLDIQNNTQIPSNLRNENQTTTGVQIMKQAYGNDKEINSLLDTIGQMRVEYPKLFKKIWNYMA